ncbi:LysR family transcriptional regulator [Comamonas endophytica]|uniref:LysR family transcriptional regulator n=1 Tax=Comamonas endophytica TaxID=2949090 RepID=A0ABY6GAA0_9BURK|nr:MULTISPECIES: LysR family transcriptional regulator [unclassified Acidovorax]MCD2514109.1 LysR family transcriptional regulator [Acidovorax sp. D4N7]UYG51250.1 LysR family transcriptional regulator [Acidovorax sp. 5MLIR]
MNLATLSLLVDIIEAGNLSRASVRLGVSRASVSQRLNQLERELGQQLLRRTTRQIEPTELGWKLYEHGRAMRQELLAASESVSSLGRGLQGTVRLSVPSGYGQLAMSAWLTEFMQLYPGVTLEVVFDNDIEDLMAGAVDFAMRVMAEPPASLVARNMGPVHYVACAAPALVREHGMPHSLAELHQVPLITSNLTGQKLRLAGHRVGRSAELRIKPRLMSANFYFLRDAILQGLGVGVVPDYMVREPLQRGELVQLPFAPGSLNFLSTNKYLLYMPTRYQTKAIATLVDFLLEKAGRQGGLPAPA